MKKLNVLTRMLLLVALLVGSTSSVWAVDRWVKTSPADLTTGDIVVIVDQATSKAMSNNNGTSAPSAVAVTLNDDKSEISSEVSTNIQWSLTTSGTGASKTFQFAKSTSYLYVTDTNNGVKVGSGEQRNTFTIVTGGNNNGYYLYNKSGKDVRYVGCYNQSDWRCYGSINNNIKGNNNAFYKKTTASGPVDPSVTIDKTTIGVGGTATISGPDGLSISYSGYDDEVVSVSDAGVVTGLKTGSTTITATWAAVTDTYNAGSKNFNVTIVPSTVYEKVTNANQLVAGNKYILVATGSNKAMGAQSSSIRNPVDVSISDNKIEIIDQEVAVLTLGGETGAWTFLASDNDKYLALTSGSNSIHASDDATNDESLWKITEDFQLNSANFPSRYIQYNSGSPRFACYEGSQQDAVLFVKAGSDVSTTVSIASACTDGEKYYGTYSNDKAFRVPADVTVSTIGIDNKGKLKVTDYSTGDIVMANTGVMISSTTAGAHTLILTESDGTENAGNLLKASGNAGIDAEAMAAASASGTKFYRLTMHGGTELGFYYGAENGGAFDLAANKAYLAVPESLANAKEGFSFISGEEETDGIKAVSTKIENGVRYNLAGQKVGADYKGIVIVNGKKMLNK